MKKSVFRSKTFWFGLATALAPMIPSVGEFIKNNSSEISMIWGALAIVLRTVTKDKVKLID